MSTEIVELKEFPGYGVDREGNVYSLERVVPHPTSGQLRLPFRKLRPGRTSRGYLTVHIRAGRRPGTYLVHRLMAFAFLDLKPGQFVDHVNRDPADNRLENLRAATNSQNQYNSPGRRKGLKGVSRHRQRWCAYITIEGATRNLGSYSTEAEAHAAYCKAAKELHGEFYYNSK